MFETYDDLVAAFPDVKLRDAECVRIRAFAHVARAKAILKKLGAPFNRHYIASPRWPGTSTPPQFSSYANPPTLAYYAVRQKATVEERNHPEDQVNDSRVFLVLKTTVNPSYAVAVSNDWSDRTELVNLATGFVVSGDPDAQFETYNAQEEVGWDFWLCRRLDEISKERGKPYP